MKKSHDERLGEIIASARIRQRLSQQQLATRAGLSMRVLSNMEQGKIPANPHEETKERLEEALGWSVGDFDRVRKGGEPSAQTRVIAEVDEDLLFIYRMAPNAPAEAIREMRKALERHL